jgi:hypothetical protein
MEIIYTGAWLIGFILFCSAFIRLGNIVVELRNLNKQFEDFLKRFEIK